MIGFTESIAKEIADNNVKVMAICPGGVDTKMIDDIVAFKWISNYKKSKS